MSRLAIVAIGAIVVAFAAPASANEAADKLAAQKLLTKGNQLLGDGDQVAALEKFREAYARYPSEKILLNIGTTLRQLGRNVEAAETYEAYLRAPKAEASRVADVQRIIVEIDAVVGRLRIETSHEEAQVRLDGKLVERFKSGMILRVEPGEHTVTAERTGFPAAVQTVTIAVREERQVRLGFAPPPPKPPNQLRTVGWAVGGVGVLGIGAGAVAGIVGVAKNNAAKGHCVSLMACDATGVALGSSARTSGDAAITLLAIGGAALVTGVVLLTVKPSASRATTVGLGVAASPGGAYLSAGGAW